MRLGIAVLMICFFSARCSNEKSKDVPLTQQTMEEKRVSEVTPQPASAGLPQDTVADAPQKSKSIFTLYAMSAQDSGVIRGAGKIIAISIKPTRVTSFSAIIPSLLKANCSDTVVGQSKVELLVDKVKDAPIYHPSVVIPPDDVCNDEIKVTLEVFGLDVELGNVLIADVVSENKPILVQ